MRILPVSNMNFNGGIIRITGPDKGHIIAINTDEISTIQSSKYINRDTENLTNLETTPNAIITMNNNNRIYTYMPISKVLDAYSTAKVRTLSELHPDRNPEIHGHIQH